MRASRLTGNYTKHIIKPNVCIIYWKDVASQRKEHIKSSTMFEKWLQNLAKTGRGRKQLVSIVLDSLLAVGSLWLAFTLRHGEPFTDFRNTWYFFAVIPVAVVVLFTSLGVYRWVVRSSNRKLFHQLVKGCCVSSLVLLALAFLIPPNSPYPRSLFAIYGLLMIFGTCGLRMVWQSMFHAGSRGEPVAIYGAGSAGLELVNSLDLSSTYQPVVFIDDNVDIAASTICGLPVLDGALEDLEFRLRSLDVDRVILAMPSISSVQYEHRLNQFESAGFAVQTIPTIAELASGKAKVGEVRDVSITDILGRHEVSLNRSLAGTSVNNKVVLVTGGGGSIGSELCRQILILAPKKLIVLDNSEPNLYHITEELNKVIASNDLDSTIFQPVLGSVTNSQCITSLIQSEKVQTVYHAAAYKHVPIIESQPEEGVRVNIFGTMATLEVAIEEKVESFVLVSTDKAVRPTNSMGASKRIAELILQAKAAQEPCTKISMVRFGNVLGSSGSVVPKFKSQIKNGGPITLTHPDITRYFMTIPEAAQLVLQAGAIAQGGDVFVLDMGEPVRIEDLATTMVRLYGKKLKRDTGVDSDIEIIVEGLRPGEKMYEELFIDGGHSKTVVPKVYTANECSLPWSQLLVLLKELEIMMRQVDRPALKAALLDLALSGQLASKEEDLPSEPQGLVRKKCTTKQKNCLRDVELSVLTTVYTAAEDEEIDATA